MLQKTYKVDFLTKKESRMMREKGMELNNIPIETISKFNTLGDIIPLRIRLEDEEHRLVTSNITDIPPKLSVSEFVGYLKGKSALMIALI